MSSSQKLLNGLSELGIQKMQEHLDYYIELVNKGDKSFSEALEELVEIEKKNNQIRRDIANVKTANFPFIKTMDDFDFDFQPNINKKEMLVGITRREKSSLESIYIVLDFLTEILIILEKYSNILLK